MTRLRMGDPPDERETREESRSTSRTWAWAGFGIVLILVFAVVLFAMRSQLLGTYQSHAPSPAAQH